MGVDLRKLAKFSFQIRVLPETEDPSIFKDESRSLRLWKEGAENRILASRVGQYADRVARLSKLFNFDDKNFLGWVKTVFPSGI